MPPQKPQKLVNERHARIAGDFIVALGDQIGRAEDDLRARAFEGAGSYVRPRSAHVKYDLEIEVASEDGDQAKKKTSHVVIDADLDIVRGSEEGLAAPLALASGFLAPAEARREEIEDAITRFDLGTPHPPILCVGSNRFWVKGPGVTSHLVVEFSPQGKPSVKVVSTLEELSREIDGLFQFMTEQLSRIYGNA